VIENEMRQLSEPHRPKSLDSPLDLKLKTEPSANCARYDAALRGACHA